MPDTVPDDRFTDRIHQALIAYHADDALATVLGELCVVRARPAHELRRGLAAAARAVLDDGLERLAETAPKSAELLVERFIRGKTARARGLRAQLFGTGLLHPAKAGGRRAGAIIWAAEQALRCAEPLSPAQRAALDSLPPPTFSRLFGVAGRGAAESVPGRADAAWLVALDGLGGMGKTALARAAAEELVSRGPFHPCRLDHGAAAGVRLGPDPDLRSRH